jgi:hypothetical protein
MRLVLYQLSLAPGDYSLTAGAWPDEASGRAYAVQQAVFSVRLAGHGGPGGFCAWIPHAWIHLDRAEGPAHEGSAVGFVDDEQRSLRTAAPVRFRLWCRVAGPDRARLTAAIQHQARVIHRTIDEEPLLPGQHLAELRFDSLPLLQGCYQLEVGLVSEDGRTLAAVERSFAVSSERFEGAGVVFSAAAWVHRPLSGEPASSLLTSRR